MNYDTNIDKKIIDGKVFDTNIDKWVDANEYLYHHCIKIAKIIFFLLMCFTIYNCIAVGV